MTNGRSTSRYSHNLFGDIFYTFDNSLRVRDGNALGVLFATIEDNQGIRQCGVEDNIFSRIT